jgi:hypothetical protein
MRREDFHGGCRTLVISKGAGLNYRAIKISHQAKRDSKYREKKPVVGSTWALDSKNPHP